MTDVLHMQLALPNDADLDSFASGVDEVDQYFRSRQWFNAAKGVSAPPTYEFRTEVGGEVVGYVSLAFRNTEHPFDRTDTRARYLVIYVFGLNRRFQGLPNPRANGESYAASIVHLLVTFARAQAGCPGLSLWVRSDNTRAIAFYRKVGFESDPDGPVQRDTGSPHLTMRRFL